ncbi:MAG TPA: ABC transporter permease [Candidatus Bathyarchaeia archaeon]|nr:ABC transporter permease [Candidatus Bathyarchaeia archaeon]
MNARSPIFRGVTALIYLFLLTPILVVAIASLNDAASLAFPPKRLSFRWYGAFMSAGEFGRATGVSVEAAVVTALITLALGTAAAYALARGPVPGGFAVFRFVVLQGLTAPLILPALVVGLALLQVYSRLGVSPSVASLVAGHAVVALPYTVRTMYAAFAAYDATLDDAAATLGARPLRTFFKVTLPLVTPSVIAGGVFAFAISFSNIMISAFLSGPSTTTLPLRMYNYIEFANDPTIAAISTVVVLATFLAVWLLHKTVGLGGFFR